MQVSQDVHDLKLLLGDFKAANDRLCAAIVGDCGYALYANDEGIYVEGDEARALIAGHLEDYRWQDIKEPASQVNTKAPGHFMVSSCSHPTFAAAVHLNAVKDGFRTFHERVRARYDNEVEASKYFRKTLLAHLGEGKLNSEAVDRHVVMMSGQPSKVRFYYHSSMFSQRKTMAEARQALWALREKSPEETQVVIDQEMAAMDRYPDDYPVSYRNRKPVITLKATVSGMIINGERVSENIYARNPILYLQNDTHTPLVVILPHQITGEKPSPRTSRSPVVSSQKVFASLDYWFRYNKVPAPRSTANRDAAIRRSPISRVPIDGSRTAVAGIWFGINAAGNPILHVRSVDGKQSSVSIKRYGLHSAWIKALHKRFDDEEMVGSAESLCPSQDSLNAFLSLRAEQSQLLSDPCV